MCRKNQKTHFMFNIFSPPKIMPFMRECGENMIEPVRPQMTIWRMRITSCVPKATNTHSEYVILIAFSMQHWLHQRALILRYVYIALQISLGRAKISELRPNTPHLGIAWPWRWWWGLCGLMLCFSNFVRPRPSIFFFHRTRARSQQIYL